MGLLRALVFFQRQPPHAQLVAGLRCDAGPFLSLAPAQPSTEIRLATNFGCSTHKAEITLWAMQDFVGLDACNDTNYLPPRHRTLPIQASVTPIANYPSKLRIFLTNASRYWQVRCYLKGKTYTQSLRTTNKQAAISQAKQFFHIKTAELYADKIEARPDKKVKFADLVPAVVVALQARVKRGEFAAANIPIFLNRMHNSMLLRCELTMS
jgi:hypothetical protein